MIDVNLIEQQAVEMDPAYIDPMRETPLHLESVTIPENFSAPHESIFGSSVEVKHADHVALSKGLTAEEEAAEAEERQTRCMALLRAGKGIARAVTGIWPDAQYGDGSFYLNSPWRGAGERRIRINAEGGLCTLSDGRKRTLIELVSMASGLSETDAADRLLELLQSPAPASFSALQRLMAQCQLDKIERAFLSHKGEATLYDLTFAEVDRFAGLVSKSGDSAKWINPTGSGILRVQGDRRDSDVFLTKDLDAALQIPTLEDIQIVVCQGVIDPLSRWNLVKAPDLLDFLAEEPIGFSGAHNLGGLM